MSDSTENFFDSPYDSDFDPEHNAMDAWWYDVLRSEQGRYADMWALLDQPAPDTSSDASTDAAAAELEARATSDGAVN